MGDFGISEIIALISAAASVGTGIYQTRAAGENQQAAINAQEQMQQQAQQQQQQQAMSQRRQQMMAEGPSLQSQVGGSLTPQAFTSMAAALTGNPGVYASPAGAGSEGSLTPAMDALFPSGGVPSLTDPYPQNV